MKKFKDIAIDQKRLYERVMQLAEIGKVGETGVERVALSDEDKQAQLVVMDWMKQAGMCVYHDHFGNLIGRKEGRDPSLPPVVIGSHIDSVKNGGRFDGVIGVVGGIEVVQSISDMGIDHLYPIEVIAFCEEEGSRFSDGLFGSRGMVGKLNKDSFELTDEKGVSRYEALKNFGFGIDPDRVDESIKTSGDMKLYLEMHIEQGPYLEVKEQPIGIVKGIAGPSWYKITIYGDGGHAGTVPMKMRKDPMSAAAEIVHHIEKICIGKSDGELVGTVGQIELFPSGVNVIPTKAEFSLDLRDIDMDRRKEALEEIKSVIDQACERRAVSYEISEKMNVPSVMCSEEIIQTMVEVCQEEQFDAEVLVSGGGHDAMLMAEITDIGMIFVRCKGGVSHHPDEFASAEDVAAGANVLYKTVLKYVN